MSELEPITREELLLNSIAGEGESGITPITRQEMYLSAIAGETELPSDMKPITREEQYYQKILDNGGAGGGGEATGTKTININSNGTTSHNVKAYATAEVTVNVPNPSTGTKEITQNGDHDVTDYATAHVEVPQPSGSTSITQNGTHNVADYEEAVVNVPNSYSASDEGKVVSNGALTAQTSRQVTANGTYDTTLNSSVEVAVPASGITPTGTKQITTNGTHDVTDYASASVNVPNSYSASDEGKVVSNGALKAQSSQSITENGTYDTTDKNSVVVDVQGGNVKQYTFSGDTTISSIALADTLLALTGTDYVFAYPTTMPVESDPNYTQLYWFVAASQTAGYVRQWRKWGAGDANPALAQGSGNMTIKAGTTLNVIGFGEEVSA